MAWRIEFTVDASREFDDLDRPVARRIQKFLRDRVAHLENPRSLGKALKGPRYGELWRYRVGDYRLICQIQDQRLVVLVVRLGHRRGVYD